MSWSLVSVWPFGSMNWSSPVEPTRLAHLVLVRDARHLDDDAALVAAHLGADLGLGHAKPADPPLDDVARGLDLLVGDGLAGLRLHRRA